MDESLNYCSRLQFFLDCKDGKGVEKSLSISSDMTFESLLNLLHREYGRPVAFVYESHGMCTVDDEASFRTCIHHVRSNFEKKGVSAASRLEAFILELDDIPRRSRTLKVGNKNAKDQGARSHLGHGLHRPTDGDRKFDWSSSERVGALKHQTIKDFSGLRDVTKSASSIPEHRPRIVAHGQTSRTSWDFEARFRQIDALMGQSQGSVEAKGITPVSKALPRTAKTAAVQIERANTGDLQAVDAAEAQVPDSRCVYPISLNSLDDRRKQVCRW
jgi:hypothetical protein